MADQLEIIDSTGNIRFHALDAGRGVTNIGRHPDNDVVLDSPRIDLFHAILDHRQQPYQLVMLGRSQSGPINVRAWDSVDIEGYVLMVVEGSGSSATPMSGGSSPTRMAARPTSAAPVVAAASYAAAPTSTYTPTQTQTPTPTARAATRPAPTAAPASTEVALGQASSISSERLDALLDRMVDLPPDHADDVILAEFIAGEFALNPENPSTLDFSLDPRSTANFQVLLTNGGDLVANFDIDVLGIEPSWVTVTPSQLNLNEGERAAIRVSITPPRLPTVWAGAHYFAVSITSPTHPGRNHTQNGMVIVKAYQEFGLGELSPKEQNVPWRKRFGRVIVPVINKGNGDEQFRVDAEDTVHGCTFEFDVPDEAPQTRQVEFTVPANSTINLPVEIHPIKRQFIGFNRRRYSYTVSVVPVNGQNTPRSLLGEVATAPLIGPILIFLLAFLLVAFVVWFSWPTVYVFTAESGGRSAVEFTSGQPLSIDAGELVTLRWQAAPFFAGLRLLDGNGAIINEISPATEPSGSLVLSPTDTIQYTLEVTTWLSKLNAAFSQQPIIPVTVGPVFPQWIQYTSGAIDIVRGQSVVYAWRVEYADAVVLVTRINNVDTRTPIPTEQIREGSLNLTPTSGVTYFLEARNRYTTDTGVATPQQLIINFLEPTNTPLPPPIILKFNVLPTVITAGQSVRVDWEVTGVVAGITKITLNGTEVGPTGSQEFFPTQNTVYNLVATSGDLLRDEKSNSVTVNPPPPTPAPPKIEFFTATPAEVVFGNPEASAVKLSWSIIGDVTNVKIVSPDFGEVANQPKQGTLTVAVTKLTQFVLTAFNGDLSTSQTVQVTVLLPTPTPTPTPTPLPTPVVTFIIEPGAGVTLLSSTNGPPARAAYSVVAGTNARFSWTITSASVNQSFIDNQGNSTVIGLTGNRTIMISNTNNATYQVVAFNAAGASVTAYVDVTLQVNPPPPAPYSVVGLSPIAPITLTWQYDPAQLASIMGYRIYRAEASTGNFAAQSPDVGSPNTFQWSDSTGGCGKAYYVVALYRELITGQILETTPSSNSWYSDPCPLRPESRRSGSTFVAANDPRTLMRAISAR